MKVTVTGPAVHQCPFVDEVDVGTFAVEYDTATGFIELHGLRRNVAAFADAAITHEDMTVALGKAYPFATVTTRWQTAGLEVECVVPRDESV